MRRTINADQFARLVIGQAIHLDGVEISLEDIGAPVIEALARRARQAAKPAASEPPTPPPARRNHFNHQANALTSPPSDATRFPPGAELLAYLDRHPADTFNAMHAVVRLNVGQVVAWNGAAFRPLPTNWADLVTLQHYQGRTPADVTHHGTNQIYQTAGR